MTYNELKELDSQYHMKTFGTRLPAVFTGGSGAVLTDSAGKEYIDFLAGIAVNCLGYSDEGFKAALEGQVDTGIVHICNYFYNEPQARLARLLCEKTGFDRVFFGNSGAEANECALKLAKKYAYGKGKDSDKFVALKKSFHGRTLLALSATGQEKFHEPFRPTAYDFTYIDANDMEAAKAAVTADKCGVILEVIQGESGVLPLHGEFVSLLRALCTEADVPLIIDEVQTGMGRTGRLLAQEHYGIKADVVTLAKALGNGIPIGACLASAPFADAFGPGDHGSTFGGNPLACAAGLYVTNKIDDKMLSHVERMGAYFSQQLEALMQKHPDTIIDVRGKGLLLGAELSGKADAHEMQRALLSQGFVIGTAGANTLRFAPPYIIMQKQIDLLIEALDRLFQ
ncbi:aspartate aminotransferase family protein [Christensenella intestinihominis]|uniref:aspartate aminotransferase family protein n=1 Tax=Christensenella intestinihominis TaxID=1851429 RepID=UPI00082DA1CE|nr:acetylornithine/succinylornithine family transaminase [Christensenella intestinihominis]